MTKSKQHLAMLSLPNCGSDWFARCVLKTQDRQYFREFFNPATNRRYEHEINHEFGSEQARDYTNLARFDMEAAREIHGKTWEKEEYDFVKENYASFKVPFFHEKFKCFALVKQLENCLPPTRTEVYSWYDSMYLSLLENRATLPDWTRRALRTDPGMNLQELRSLSFLIYKKKLMEECLSHGIPVFSFETVCCESEAFLKKYLDVGVFANVPGLVAEVIATRTKKMRGNLGIDYFTDSIQHHMYRLQQPWEPSKVKSEMIFF